MQYKVILGFPRGGSVEYGAVRGAFMASREHELLIQDVPTSLPTCGFNALWCQALNKATTAECTHFAMLHADVSPENGWLDTMLREMDRLDADLISAPVAIKDQRAVTSTAIGQRGVTWHAHRRLTVKEAARLPETFCLEDTCYRPPEYQLLHNTGCWVADLRKCVFYQRSAAGELLAHFTVNDRIVGEPGSFAAEVEPEDWFFSRRLDEIGAKTYVTRKVKIDHEGSQSFPNHGSWGLYDNDKDTQEFWLKDEVSPTGAWRNGLFSFYFFDEMAAAALVDLFRGVTVVDLGCGDGSYVRYLNGHGVVAHGVDGNPSVLHNEPTGHFHQHDLSTPVPARADWGLSFEVGEHIPAEFESVFLDNLANTGTTGLVVSWAVEGDAGVGHVNCRSEEYVRDQLEKRGLVFDEDATWRFRAAARLPYLRRKAMVFRKVTP